MNGVFTQAFVSPIEDRSEIYRYLKAKPTNDIDVLVDSAMDEARSELSYYVRYTVVDLENDGMNIKLGGLEVNSKDLCKCLYGCDKAVIFAATLGSGIDRLIGKYSKLQPSRALVLQAYGSERIEALCDAFCDEIINSTKRKLSPRFSAGYGDLTLEFQREIFDILDCGKIGLTLNESLLMSPSKSVTAIAGLKKQE